MFLYLVIYSGYLLYFFLYYSLSKSYILKIIYSQNYVLPKLYIPKITILLAIWFIALVITGIFEIVFIPRI
jgi:hypothetical protein